MGEIRSDNIYCKKCGKELKHEKITADGWDEYTPYSYTYKKVDKSEPYEMGGFGEFYCKDCYCEFENTEVSTIINMGDNFLSKDIPKLYKELNNFYNSKLKEIKKLEKFIKETNNSLINKKYIKDIDIKISKNILKHCDAYDFLNNKIEVGYPINGTIGVYIKNYLKRR